MTIKELRDAVKGLGRETAIAVEIDGQLYASHGIRLVACDVARDDYGFDEDLIVISCEAVDDGQ